VTPELEGLRALAEALPPGTPVPVPATILRELQRCSDGGIRPQPIAPADLTVPEVAERFRRHPATVRGWRERGLLPGAYHLRRRDWRVPPAAIAAFESQQRAEPTAAAPQHLDDWRKVAAGHSV
jgi:hypothetical protein